MKAANARKLKKKNLFEVPVILFGSGRRVWGWGDFEAAFYSMINTFVELFK